MLPIESGLMLAGGSTYLLPLNFPFIRESYHTQELLADPPLSTFLLNAEVQGLQMSTSVQLLYMCSNDSAH